MKKNLAEYFNKLYFKKWVIGICQYDIKDIIKNQKFDPDIRWLFKKSFDKFYADPFLLNSYNGNIKILFEEYPFEDAYGKISLLTLDESFKYVGHQSLLDTKSHLSYPFVFSEKNKTYVFPEARESGKLSCYEFNPVDESLSFIQDILILPLLDSTIIKHNNKYWIFGTLSRDITDYRLHVFFSDSLFGPYMPHPGNPIKNGLNGTRSAGKFIEVDNVIYRPTQNCKEEYGESITINKITELNEINICEEPYLTICINKKNNCNKGMHSIHTINVMENIIIVDGERWIFSPFQQFKKKFF